MAEEGGRAGELGQDVEAGRAGPAVVQLHLVSQAPRLRARLKIERVKTVRCLHRISDFNIYFTIPQKSLQLSI